MMITKWRVVRPTISQMEWAASREPLFGLGSRGQAGTGIMTPPRETGPAPHGASLNMGNVQQGPAATRPSPREFWSGTMWRPETSRGRHTRDCNCSTPAACLPRCWPVPSFPCRTHATAHSIRFTRPANCAATSSPVAAPCSHRYTGDPPHRRVVSISTPRLK